jgi:hypothetical protein
MKVVINSDIINSIKVFSSLWREDLKSVLIANGNEPKDWEIYIGDSFSWWSILLPQ